jgi:hypothetical protein
LDLVFLEQLEKSRDADICGEEASTVVCKVVVWMLAGA